MRVYGSSPLYNYVELIFRSKRLFITSIVAATLVTAVLAARRVGMYNATAVVTLTGNSGVNTMDAVGSSAVGSVRDKLSILKDVVVQDKQFFIDAFKEKGLDRGRSAPEFDKFCRDAHGALNFGTGENTLNINCRWPDGSEAEQIINAFYSAYSARVLDRETATSQMRTKLITSNLADYTRKQQDIERKVIAYRKAHIGIAQAEFSQANSSYITQQQVVKAQEADLRMAQQGMVELDRLLATTPKTVLESEVHQGPTQSAEYTNLQNRKSDLEVKLSDLMQKYTESAPEVRKTKAQLAEATDSLSALEKTASGKPSKPGPVKQTTTMLNPQWQSLAAQAANQRVGIQRLTAQLQNSRAAEAEALRQASTSPDEQFAFKWMVNDLTLYTSIRDNLRARLEQARMDEAQERKLHLAEMTMAIRPEAEAEVVGAKSLLFYAAGPILGLLIAFVFSLLAETLDHSLRTPIEVEKHLGKPVLAVLPRMDGRGAEARRQLGGEAARPSLPS